jgi:hypothetical protein
MKIIALYLPQFHRVAENDKWWGEGFTDWESVRRAKPMFKGHYQPHVPLDENYYNLLDKKTMEWQADLMKKYGVDGLCFYHYWFENGKQILEQPAENLLKWTDIDMPFCFSWANETWARSWSGIQGANVWSEVGEGSKGKDDGILLRQEYGKEADWKEHFMYLLPFFKDSRYIRVDNKPVFMIYKTNQIGCLEEMLECWRELAIQNGLDGIYVIGGNSEGIGINVIDAHYLHEPTHANRKVMQGMYGEGIKRLLYTDVWNEILSLKTGEEKTYYGGFVGYDDTPRRESHGLVIENATSELFGAFLAQLFAKNKACGNEITFINAWNEWGEGMHLEPDKANGYRYLEQIQIARSSYQSYIPYYKQIQNRDEENRNEKHELYLNDLDKWMENREKGRRICDWLIKNNYMKVAIYGYGIMGRHLITELISDGKVSVEYVIDKKRHVLKDNLRCYIPTEKHPDADAIIVSSYYFLDSIKKQLPENQAVISLRDIIMEQHED